MEAVNQVLKNLPDETFSRQDWLDAVAPLGYSLSHANGLMYEALYQSKIERIKRGKYQVVNSEEAVQAI